MITADGTYYALTINNALKLKDYYTFLPLLNPPYDLSRNQEYINSYNEYKSMYNDYYGEKENPNSKIMTSSLDNEGDEKAFLEILQNNNLGITLFETNANFDEFTKVTLDDNDNVIPETCN